MAPGKPNSPTHVAPSKPLLLRFIVALFLVKSKTTNTSVRDYLSQLRLWITQGRRPDILTAVHSHVDTSEFWKDAYKNSEETVMELRAKVFQLERRCERQDEQKSQASTGANSQRKRKRASTEVGGDSSNRPPKQAKTTAPALAVRVEDTLLPGFVDEWEDLPLDPHTTAILHKIYLLQRISSQQKPPAQEHATMLSQISTGISQMILTIGLSTAIENPSNASTRNSTTRAQRRSFTEVQTKENIDLDRKALGIVRTFRLLLKSMDLLDQTPAGQALQGQVVYSFIVLFRDLINQICNLAASCPEENHIKAAQNTQKPRSARSTIASAAPKNEKTITTLSDLLISMATSLDSSKQTHQAIMDGFLHFLLTRISELLTVFVFSDTDPLSRLTTAKKDDTSPIAITDNRNLDESTGESQAPHLISILSHLPSLTTHQFAGKARVRLQHTLLKSIFVHHTDEFVHGLTEPSDPSVDLNSDLTANMDLIGRKYKGNVGDWYKSEVWRIVGWEILSDHIEWPEAVETA